MTMADRIAVMDRGRVVQVATPGDLYEQPKTRFVAEFVGKANILTGRFDSAGQLQLGDGIKIRVTTAAESLAAGQVAVCLRPHNILLVSDNGEARQMADQGYNLFSGIIRRSIYFGDAIDYTVELASRESLRVITPPSQRFDPGQSICAAAHPRDCVVLREE